MQRPDEEVGEERRDEHVQRIHPAEAPVDGERRGRRSHCRGDDARDRPREASREIEAQGYRREGGDHGQPAETLGARVEPERRVCEYEVEWRAAAVYHDGLEHLGERPHRDQPGDRLVLVVRLPAHVRLKAVEKEAAERAYCRDAAESPYDSRTTRKVGSLSPRRRSL